MGFKALLVPQIFNVSDSVSYRVTLANHVHILMMMMAPRYHPQGNRFRQTFYQKQRKDFRFPIYRTNRGRLTKRVLLVAFTLSSPVISSWITRWMLRTTQPFVLIHRVKIERRGRQVDKSNISPPHFYVLYTHRAPKRNTAIGYIGFSANVQLLE